MRVIQTLIFSKNKFTRKQALKWAKDNKFKYYTSRVTKDTIRLRQFNPDKIKRVLGTFDFGKSGIKALYVIKK